MGNKKGMKLVDERSGESIELMTEESSGLFFLDVQPIRKTNDSVFLVDTVSDSKVTNKHDINYLHSLLACQRECSPCH
jgi:hypothetical protein